MKLNFLIIFVALIFVASPLVLAETNQTNQTAPEQIFMNKVNEASLSDNPFNSLLVYTINLFWENYILHKRIEYMRDNWHEKCYCGSSIQPPQPTVNENAWCHGADVNQDGIVDMEDYVIIGDGDGYNNWFSHFGETGCTA